MDHFTELFGEPHAVEEGAPAPPVPELSPHEAALIAEACSKSGVVWIRQGGEARHHPAWHVWHADAVHVVYGVDEQMLPLLTGEVEVVARSKETSQQIVAFVALVQTLTARSLEWEAAADALSAKRLNALDPDSQRDRWAAGTLLLRLTPLRLLHAVTGGDDAPSGAAPPPPSAGTTIGRRPFHLGGRGRRRRAGR